MSNFACDKCGAICRDSGRGFISGCEHYPPDIKPLPALGFQLDLKSAGALRWYVDSYGQRRYLHNDSLVEE